MPWLDSPRSRIERHLIRGEIDDAKVIALEEDLKTELVDSLNTRFRYKTSMYQELAETPEVAARLRERNTESFAGVLSDLQQVARKRGNTFEALMEAGKACSLGQMSHALYEVGGEYRRNM